MPKIPGFRGVRSRASPHRMPGTVQRPVNSIILQEALWSIRNSNEIGMVKKTAPLNALRAFEAAARTGSFANAAREFGVSPAAISQQVRLLEEFWGTTLFVRQGNRIALTDAGLTAYPSLGEAMSSIEELSRQMLRTPHRNRLVLSAPQSVAETWACLPAVRARPARPGPAAGHPH